MPAPSTDSHAPAMFHCFAAEQAFAFESTHGAYRFRVSTWRDGGIEFDNGGTHFGVVVSDAARLTAPHGEFPISAGMYFSLPGSGAIEGAGFGIVVSQFNYRGFFQMGGPIESRGRLRYIDGCSDSLLIPPITRGEACLNLLHIPPATDQTPHTHPSFRVGMVMRGTGACRTDGGVQTLTAGRGFMIPADCLHSFHTADDELLIVAFHPDSDWGPTDDYHPMLNRTIVDGVSASDARATQAAPRPPGTRS